MGDIRGNHGDQETDRRGPVGLFLADIKAHESELKENIRRELVAGFLVHPDNLSEDLVQVIIHHLEYRAKKQGWIKE